MSAAVGYSIDRASEAEIVAHLNACDGAFVPPLSSRVPIDGYARKIAEKAERFEAWSNGLLIGLVAAYCNEPDRGTAFVTSVSVLPGWQGRGIASQLMTNCVRHVHGLGFADIELDVDGSNRAAIALYGKHGFRAMARQGAAQRLQLNLRQGDADEPAA